MHTKTATSIQTHNMAFKQTNTRSIYTRIIQRRYINTNITEAYIQTHKEAYIQRGIHTKRYTQKDEYRQSVLNTRCLTYIEAYIQRDIHTKS